jgi:hypothetical protein
MYYQLSKSQKKVARFVIDKGLANHYRRALTETEIVIRKWHNGEYEDVKDAYMNLFNCVDRNENTIARIYNDKGGLRWVEVMANQLSEGVITIDDLKDFDEEVRKVIIGWSGI